MRRLAALVTFACISSYKEIFLARLLLVFVSFVGSGRVLDIDRVEEALRLLLVVVLVHVHWVY